jgi:hypothetical protein
MDYLALYSEKCKRCGHLDPEAPKKFNNCHFSKGNTECPAQEVQFAVVGEAKRFAAAAKKARKAGNLAMEAEILDTVAKRSPAFQHKFQEWFGG